MEMCVAKTSREETRAMNPVGDLRPAPHWNQKFASLIWHVHLLVPVKDLAVDGSNLEKSNGTAGPSKELDGYHLDRTVGMKASFARQRSAS